MKIIISGGGTGGHIFPAIAVADELMRVNPNAEILFIGALGKMEMERVPKAGYAIEGLSISGFQRKLSWKNLVFPFKTLAAIWKANGIIRRFRPDVALGFGGYASGPALRASAKHGVPTILQEQNSYAGMTNKILALRAKKICVAYEGMEAFFPKDKIILTGNPVRKDLIETDGRSSVQRRSEGIAYFGLDGTKKTILILGGSLGARTLNQAVEASASALEIRKADVQVLWQCGKLYEDQFRPLKAANLNNVKMSAFIDRMDLAYSVADVVIARAGALTVSELCLRGKPAILVPSPNVAEDHQTKNAMALVNRQAAVLVRDAEAKENMIIKALEILDNEVTGASLANNIKKMGRPDAAQRIAAAAMEAAGC